MVEVRMTMDEYLTLLGGMAEMPVSVEASNEMPVSKKKRSSAYSRRYKANFRKVEADFKKKNGQWKKNGFKSAVKLAHKMSKK